MDGPVIPDGFVVFEGKTITAVGPMEALPAGYSGPVLDAAGGHILPGFVDAHCHLGLWGDGLGFEDAWAGPVLEPVLASVWGLLLFGERPGVLVVFGGTLILLGIGLYSREEA